MAIVLTAQTPAAIAVIRLIGMPLRDFARKHLTRTPQLTRPVYCDLHENNKTIDDVVAVLMGEDRLDLNLHGGPWVVEAALRLAAAAGFNLVSWQTAAALATDAVDAVEAEVAAALPYATTRESLAIMLAQPAAWRAMIAAPDPAAIRRASADRTIERILHPPTVAITGRPNAGKSTLVNRLSGQARSIVSAAAGTTRDYVTTPANLAGLIVNLIDTPGQRETADSIEGAAIARAADIIRGADVVIDLRDASSVDAAAPAERPNAMVVWNKCDRLAAPLQGLQISAATGGGIGGLIDAIHAAAGVEGMSSLHTRCWTQRQRQVLAGIANFALP